MKNRILTATALAALLVMGGCSNNPLKPGGGMEPGASATTPISEQVAINDFTRLGVKVKYKLTVKMLFVNRSVLLNSKLRKV